MKIDNIKIGKHFKPYIIAELSGNHNQSLDKAMKIIHEAAKCGVDALKIQTYTADTMTINVKSKNFYIKDKSSLWANNSLYDLYKKAYTPWDWHKKLFEIAREEGLICFSTPFDKSAVDFLEELDNPIYKIASFEITDIPLIDYIASKEKPIILSTGIAEKSDIELALKTIRNRNSNQIVLLKCTSSYPAPLDEANLLTLTDYTKSFGVLPGISDHTLGITAPIVATALGAKVIEKHFILDKSIGGPDSAFSLDQNEFSEMVKNVRDVEKSRGKIDYNLTEKQKKGKDFSRSLYIVEDVKKGDLITEENIKSIRPGFGMHPKYFSQVLGKKFVNDFDKGTRLDQKIFK